MRNVFIFLFLFCTVFVKAQDYDLSFVNYTQPSMSVSFAAIDKKESPKAYKQTPYWKKHKVLKGFAWGALGVGICGMGTAIVIDVLAGFDTGSDYSRDDKITFNLIFFTSLGVTASSIPLFIFANKNKRKAKRAVELSLNTSHIYMTLPNGRHQAEPALGLCINF